MKNRVVPITELKGIVTNIDEVSMPLGGMLSCANMARYVPDRFQRIPGLVDIETVSSAGNGFPIGFTARISGTEYLFVVRSSDSATADVYNLTSAAALTGGASLANNNTGYMAGIWTTTYYSGGVYVSNGLQAIQRITGATTKVSISTGGDPGAVTPPKGSLIKSYLGRLYVAGVTEVAGVAATDTDKSRVWYSKSLDGPTAFNFLATNYFSVDEVPGEVTALAVNSPTSSGSTIVGELIVAKPTGIIKLNGDPAASNSAKDVVSASIGSEAPHTFVNTPIGLFFLGQSGGILSVYYLPVGSQGEPQDVGQVLRDVLNDVSNPISNIRLSTAIYHDGFYKLFINRNGTILEEWLDIREIVQSDNMYWYGSHTRKAKQAPTVMANGELRVFEVIAGVGHHFRENTSKTSGFIDANGDALVAVLDIPLNVEPLVDEKVYDLLNVYFAKEANINSNQITVEKFLEGVAQGGSSSQSIYDSTTSSGSQIKVPVTGVNGASLAGRTARVKISHTTNTRLDILRLELQYLAHEDERVRS